MKELIKAQKREITESKIYLYLSKKAQREKQREILKELSEEEKKHYLLLKKYTNKDVGASIFKVLLYVLLSKIFGMVFSLKLMERGELFSKKFYEKFEEKEIKKLAVDEELHEKKLIEALKDERVLYSGAIVLGLSDALIELSGALVGMLFAISETKFVGIAGLIIGLSAALSMAASSFFELREEHNKLNPIKGAIYTGITYFGVVLLLVLPYLLIVEKILALILSIFFAILTIAIYSFFVSVAKEQGFKKKFFEMVIVLFFVALVSFLFGRSLDYFIK